MILYAQPYDVSVGGFYFRTAEGYDQQFANLKSGFGQQVEELEIRLCSLRR